MKKYAYKICERLYIKTEIWSIINKIKEVGRLKLKCIVRLLSIVWQRADRSSPKFATADKWSRGVLEQARSLRYHMTACVNYSFGDYIATSGSWHIGSIMFKTTFTTWDVRTCTTRSCCLLNDLSKRRVSYLKIEHSLMNSNITEAPIYVRVSSVCYPRNVLFTGPRNPTKYLKDLWQKLIM
jgi:hypothetical protein